MKLPVCAVRRKLLPYSENFVRHTVCVARRAIPRKLFSYLCSTYGDFLRSEATLREWAGLTMAERCVRFHRTFPEVRCSVTTLRKVYRRLAISYRKVKLVAEQSQRANNGLGEKRMVARAQLAAAKASGHKIVFLDECMFSYSTKPAATFWLKGQQLELTSFQRFQKPLALLAGISAEKGWETIHYMPMAFNGETIMDYMVDLRASNGDIKLAVFWDNLAAHKSTKVQKAWPN